MSTPYSTHTRESTETAAILKMLVKPSAPAALVMESPDPENKTLAEELGLAFNNLTPLERSMLLSARAARVVGYAVDGKATIPR